MVYVHVCGILTSYKDMLNSELAPNEITEPHGLDNKTAEAGMKLMTQTRT